MSPQVPSEVADLIRMAQKSVGEVIGIEPDLTPETLPLVDQYLRDLVQETREEVLDLVLSSVGCYFGEVVRRKLNGRWAAYGSNPGHWRVELTNCFLHFRPVGMAAEVFNQGTSEEYDGSFATLDELRDGLGQMLADAAPLTEEEYYSLSCRVEVLQLAADWLMGRRLAKGKNPRHYSAEDYSSRLDVDEEP